MTNPARTPVRVYRATDAPEGGLAGEAVAVLGYGNLGRTAALNLRDSGAKVRIGNREDEYAERARREGFEVVPIPTAAADDVGYVLLPDEVIPDVFGRDVALDLRPDSATALGGGITRSLEMDREAMADRFRHVLEDIKSGGFAQRFQDEARNGYPMLELARASMHGRSPMAEAEERIRHLAGPDRAAPGAGGPA